MSTYVQYVKQINNNNNFLQQNFLFWVQQCRLVIFGSELIVFYNKKYTLFCMYNCRKCSTTNKTRLFVFTANIPDIYYYKHKQKCTLMYQTCKCTLSIPHISIGLYRHSFKHVYEAVGLNFFR